MRNKCVHELSASFSYSYGNSYKAMLKPVPSNALACVAATKRMSPSLNTMAPVVI